MRPLAHSSACTDAVHQLRNDRCRETRQNSLLAMSRYFLSAHVHLCLSEGQVILLDLKRDKYLGLGSVESQALGGLIDGWPCEELPTVASGPRTDDGGSRDELLASMVQAGLLTAAETRRRLAPDIALEPARAALADLPVAPRLNATHVFKFVLACVTAAVRLKWTTLEKSVKTFEAQKAKRQGTVQNDIGRVTELVAIFLMLRPFLFTARDACLFDSFALATFLSMYGVFPKWVLGVLAAPFSAHSWLQFGDVVLNDTPEHVLRYQPILVV